MGKHKKTLIIVRNYRSSLAKELRANFLHTLLSEISEQVPDYNEQLVVLSSDDEPDDSGEETFNVVRVPSMFIPKGVARLEYLRDLWFVNQGRVPLRRKVFQANVDSLRVSRKAAKMLPDTKAIHWFEAFSPFDGGFRLFSRLYRVKNYMSLSAFKREPWLYNQLLKISMQGIDKLIVSPMALKSFVAKSQSIGFPGSKVYQIPLGVDLSSFKPSLNRSGLKQSEGIDPNRKVISWFGPITPSLPQDFYYLLSCVPRVQERASAFFVFAFKYGQPPDCHPSCSDVRFYDSLTSIADVLSITDIVVLPFASGNKHIFQPLTIPEALACGVPVITVNNPGLDEMVIDGFNGILVQSREDIPQAIVSLCHEEHKLKEMSINARRYAEEHFDIKAVARAYANLWGLQ